MRKVIILDTKKAQDGVTQIQVVNWFDIPTATARVPRPGFSSAANQLSGAKVITTAEQIALEDGSVREESYQVLLSASDTNAQIRAELERRYNDKAAAIAAEPPTRQFYGSSWDGTAWTA